MLPAGSVSRRAADLIGSGLQHCWTSAAAQYDLVILDAPPLLGFAEPLQMATAVDGVVIVARAGQTSRKGRRECTQHAASAEGECGGLVLNEVHKEISDTYYYYGYYGKYYKHYNGVNVISTSDLASMSRGTLHRSATLAAVKSFRLPLIKRHLVHCYRS